MKRTNSRPRFRIALCKRGCGREIYVTDRPVYGANQALHDKYSGICQYCVTPEEKNEQLHAIGSNLVRMAQNG